MAKNEQQEQQNVTEKYRALNPSDQMLFQTVLNLAVILLQNMQQTTKGGARNAAQTK